MASSLRRAIARGDAVRTIQVLQDLIAASATSIPCHPARDAAIYLVVELESRERAHRELEQAEGGAA